MSTKPTKIQLANHSMGNMYKLWDKWKDDPDTFNKNQALQAKTIGLIFWDRIMFQRESIGS